MESSTQVPFVNSFNISTLKQDAMLLKTLLIHIVNYAFVIPFSSYSSKDGFTLKVNYAFVIPSMLTMHLRFLLSLDYRSHSLCEEVGGAV